MSAIIGYENHVLAATLSATDAVGGLGVANLAGAQGSPSRAWQTPSGVLAASAYFDAGDPAATWQAFLLARTNLSASATVRWLVGPWESFAGGPGLMMDTNTMPAGIVPGIGQSLFVASAEVAGQACRVDVADPGNPQGFLSIALAYAGPCWRLAGNIGADSTRGRTDQAGSVQTRGGQQYPTLLSSQRRWEISIPSARLIEEPRLLALDAACRGDLNILFAPDPDSPTRNADAVFGLLAPKSDLSFPAPDRRAWRGSLTERL